MRSMTVAANALLMELAEAESDVVMLFERMTDEQAKEVKAAQRVVLLKQALQLMDAIEELK